MYYYFSYANKELNSYQLDESPQPKPGYVTSNEISPGISSGKGSHEPEDEKKLSAEEDMVRSVPSIVLEKFRFRP
jgi:hypothetical protein